MRPVTINPLDPPSALNEIMRASHEGDVVEIAQNFTLNGALTQQLQLNVGAPNLTNVVQVLGTLLTIMQKGGLNRTT